MSYTFSITDWHQSQHAIKTLRERVFVLEWQIPSRLEFDENDSNAFHLLVSSTEGNTIATARMTQHGEIGRIAVRPEHRSMQLYTLLFQYLLTFARSNNIENVSVVCNLDGVADLQKRGFEASGRVFMEAGVPMQRLRLQQQQNWELPDIRQLH